MIVTSFGIGILFGFIFFEITGLTAGGIIVPGYLALFVYEPVRILITIFVSITAYGLVNLASGYFIIFGRRRFLLMILTGFILRAGLDQLPLLISNLSIEFRAIGYIIPGLIANEFYRQGVLKTLLAMGTVTVAVFLCLQVIYF